MDKHILALQLIGAEIQTYGHFASYSIPYADGRSITSETDVTLDEFLQLVEEYFNDKTRINYSYGDDTKEQNSVKRFVKKRINSESENLGREWVNNHHFKE